MVKEKDEEKTTNFLLNLGLKKPRIIKDSDFSKEKRIDLIKRVINWIYKAIYLQPDEKEMEINHLKILI